MRNDEVARIFSRTADLLELKGESGFWARSDQHAARPIEHWAVSIERLAREGGLKSIPGVGNAVAKKTDELTKTERLAYYSRLVAELPPGVEHLLAVPGTGPKRTLAVAHDLQVSTNENPEAATADGTLASFPQFRDVAAENLLKSLRFGVGVTRRAWCTRNNIPNIAPWPRFQEVIQRNRNLASSPATR